MIAIAKKWGSWPKDIGGKSISFLPWRRLPRLALLIDADFRPKLYKIMISFAGKIALQELNEETNHDLLQKDCLIGIHPSLIFRRRLQVDDSAPLADIKRMMPGLFPFPPDESLYALLVESGEGNASYAACLRSQDYERLKQMAPACASILVSESTPEALLKSIQARFKQGSAVDFMLRPPQFLSPSISQAFFLTIVLLLIVVAGFFALSWQKQYLQQRLVQEVETLSLNGAELEMRYNALSKMQASLQALEKFEAQTGAKSFALLRQAMATAPEGVSIDRIELKNGRIIISGLGKNPQNWLQNLGVNANDITITPLPQFDRYVAPLP